MFVRDYDNPKQSQKKSFTKFIQPIQHRCVKPNCSKIDDYPPEVKLQK